MDEQSKPQPGEPLSVNYIDCEAAAPFFRMSTFTKVNSQDNAIR